MKFKDNFKKFCKNNKGLLVTALILNITFLTIVILSLCGINIAKLGVENEFLNNLNIWLYENQFAQIVSGLIFASNIYFAVAVTANDYTIKPLLYTICLTPVFIFFQYGVGVNPLWISCFVPICLCMAYSFKFSTLWKSVLFMAIIIGYQYLMQMAKLSLFGLEYLSTNILNYILLNIDLYVVFIFYFMICKSIYKNKKEKEVIKQ